MKTKHYNITYNYIMNNIEKLKKIKLLKKLVVKPEDINKYLQINEDIYEILGMINVGGNKLGFNSDCFTKYKKDEQEYLQLLECPEVEEGMFTCEHCKSKKIFTMSKQTRSGDEATTVFARCSECKKGWIIN